MGENEMKEYEDMTLEEQEQVEEQEEQLDREMEIQTVLSGIQNLTVILKGNDSLTNKLNRVYYELNDEFIKAGFLGGKNESTS